MPATPPLLRAARALALIAITGGALLTAGCGKIEADRSAIQNDLGLAYGAYTKYVSGPAERGAISPSTSRDDRTLARASDAAKYATLAVEAARQEAAPDVKFASFAQKTAAAGASLNAVSEALTSNRATRALAMGGLASLESLLASGRDIGLKIEAKPVAEKDLGSPPVP